MAIKLDKIKEIYGEETIEDLTDEERFSEFEKNVLYLKEKRIEDIDDVVESYFLMFLYDHDDFKKKVDSLIERLGENYIELLGEDMSYWEELM